MILKTTYIPQLYSSIASSIAKPPITALIPKQASKLSTSQVLVSKHVTVLCKPSAQSAPTTTNNMAKFVQDMPPKGGYPYPVQWRRNVPARGFRPSVYAAGLVGFCSYGFYLLCSGIRERNELAREQTWSRFHILPLLQAESDRDYFRRFSNLRAREAEIMANVPGFDADQSVYHEEKFHKPAVLAFPKI